ncbi:MAG: alkaline phosphatase family protein [Mycobacterium sp.]
MGYPNYIGRVGALAIALGLGMAVATTPGVAVAEPAEESSTSTTDADTAADPAPEPEPEPAEEPALEDDDDPPPDDGQDGDVEEPTDPVGDGDTTPAPGEHHPPPAETTQENVGSNHVAAEDDPEDNQVEDRFENTEPATRVRRGGVDPTLTAAGDTEQQLPTFSSFSLTDVPAPLTYPEPSAEMFSAGAAARTTVAPAVPQRSNIAVNLVSDIVASILQPLLAPGDGSPIQLPILTAVLALVRNEFERILAPRKAIAPQQTVTVLKEPSAQLVEPANQRILVVAVDGTNLSRVIEDCDCENFDALMATSTTGPSSIVGHTTISNPSWTAIMTGFWGERTGVINNVYNPRVYDRYPTLFSQIEASNPALDTYVVADWNVINAIGGSGADGADENYYVAQIENDTNWLATDDAVAQAARDVIPKTGEAPNLVYAYFVGVDENGHMYGGDSPEYLAAVENMDDNLGLLVHAVADREAATGEDWTIIVVTDHGHQPQQGLGHGFQSPDETETFVIIDGPGFADGGVNPDYQIVDTTPTILSVLGVGVSRSNGVPLSVHDGSTVVPPADDLEQALLDQIATNKAPNVVTQVRLGIRTIFATIPYLVEDTRAGAIGGLPPFLALPATILFDGLYVVTNVPAQIVAFATGVWGVRLFPLVPAPIPVYPPPPTADVAGLAQALSA